MGDQRPIAGLLRQGDGGFGAGGQQGRLERIDIIRQGGKLGVHAGIESRTRLPWHCFQQLVAAIPPIADARSAAGCASRFPRADSSSDRLSAPPRHRLLWPHEASAVQTLGIKRQAQAIVPNRLQQRAAATPKDEDITRERIPTEPSCTSSARPGTPRRMSVWPVASQIRTLLAIGITRATPPARAAGRPGLHRCQRGPDVRCQARSRSDQAHPRTAMPMPSAVSHQAVRPPCLPT